MTVQVIKNTSNEKFMVCSRTGLCESLTTPYTYETYEEAYRVAKAYGWGREPIDETRHH